MRSCDRAVPVFSWQKSWSAGTRTAAAGSTAGTATAPSTWCVPAPGTTPCTKMGRDACRQVKQGRLGLPQARGKLAGSDFSFTNCRRAADAAATAAST